MTTIINGIDLANPVINGVDLTKLVQFKTPQPGEEKLIFRVVNYNEVTRRIIIELVSDKFTIPPRELVSIDDVINL